jgi:hypothetical protein
VGTPSFAAVALAVGFLAAACSEDPQEGNVTGTLYLTRGTFKCLAEPCEPLPTEGES